MNREKVVKKIKSVTVCLVLSGWVVWTLYCLGELP